MKTELEIAVSAAWLTHVAWTVKAITSGATVGQGLLGAMGVCLPPVGVVHGIVLWVL